MTHGQPRTWHDGPYSSSPPARNGLDTTADRPICVACGTSWQQCAVIKEACCITCVEHPGTTHRPPGPGGAAHPR